MWRVLRNTHVALYLNIEYMADFGPPPPPGQEDTAKQLVDGWFIAFAPARKPKLAVAVMLIDASGDGGTTAAPIARTILGSAL